MVVDPLGRPAPERVPPPPDYGKLSVKALLDHNEQQPVEAFLRSQN